MAIIKCKECGKEVSTKAKTCPNCGIEVAGKIKRKRKRIIFFSLASFFTILATCSYQDYKEKQHQQLQIQQEKQRQEQHARAEAYAKLTPEQKQTYDAQQKRLAEQRAKETAERQKQAKLASEKAAITAQQQKEQKRCQDSSMAYVMSQKFIKQRLKAPTTAKFPWSGDPAVKIQYVGDCKHKIQAYVDSQNGFGAMIRTTYYIELQYIKGSQGIGSWRELDFQQQN